MIIYDLIFDLLKENGFDVDTHKITVDETVEEILNKIK